jgi:integrase
MSFGMIAITYPFLVRDTDRRGNHRYYVRRKGMRKVRLRATPGTPDFESEYRLALSQGETWAQAATKEGTWQWLCERYTASTDFLALGVTTQKARRLILESTWLEPREPGSAEVFARCPIVRMTPKHVVVLRDRKASLPEAANGRVKAIRQVFRWAQANGIVGGNPAMEVPYVRSSSGGHHSWTPEEVSQFMRRHPLGTKAHLALCLLLWTGVRRSDVVRLGKQHVRSGKLVFTAAKNQRRKPMTVEIPILAQLQAVLDASPTGDLTFLITQFGRPFTVAGFGGWFRRRCDEAGLGHCSAHGLRKAGAATAAENGATTQQLMAIFAWSTSKEAERYTRAAQRAKMAGDGMPLLIRK